MFLDAFSDLSTMRSYEGGPIPFDKRLWYAIEILGLDDSTGEIFTAVIGEMDMVYQEWGQKERDKARPKTTSSDTSGSPRSPRSSGRPPARRR